MKTLFIKDLKPGLEVAEFFVLRKKELKEYNGQRFLKLELGDRSGRIDGIVWDNSDQLYDKAKVGEIVKVKGLVGTYKEMPQIKVDKIRKAKDEEIDLVDFLPQSEKNFNLLYDDFKDIVQTIKNSYLRRLLDLLIEDSSLMERFKRAPGGKLWHHARVGGLLEHTLRVVSICEKATEMYDLVDRDLLITGALVHDIGKVNSYSAGGFFDYTDEGRLLGHIVSGDELIDRKIQKIPDFPQNLALKLKHLILSHQGQLEFASPVLPQTIEAIILHYADELDAKADAFSHIIKTQKVKGKRWSDWVRLINRFIYLGEDEKQEGQSQN
ncbi:MAG: HD domain-containing protein [candidate division Zixibacteria bacterium]|nr:HD domain-containing protein [candidate division Zixibacteria bacterium]